MARQSRNRGASSEQAALPSPERSSASIESGPTDEQASIFNTTFSLHRVSPLFIGAEALTETRLQVLAGRLRDTLVGDVVRGVELGLEGSDMGMGAAGALEMVTTELVPLDSVIETTRKGLSLSLQYENALSSALLLPTPENDSGNGHFLHLPLLLLRMPMPLKVVVIDFLSSTFDCRVSNIRLGTKDIVHAWESWIRDTGLPNRGAFAKDAVLTLAFDLPHTSKTAEQTDTKAAGPDSQGIKAIDVIIPTADLRRFHNAGQAINAAGQDAEHPFTNAVAQYIKHHLALDVWHQGVRIIRIACGGFVLSESRIKILGSLDDADDSPHRAAVRQLFGNLAVRARGIVLAD